MATRHGVTVGWFIPTPMDRDVQVASLRSAASALEVVLSDGGVVVDDLVAEFAAARPAR